MTIPRLFSRPLFLALAALLLTYMPSAAQIFRIKVGNGPEFRTDSIPEFPNFINKITKLEIRSLTADNPPKTFFVQAGDTSMPFQTNGQFHTLTFPDDIRGSISILDSTGTAIGTSISLPADKGTAATSAAGGQPAIVVNGPKTAAQYVFSLFPGQLKNVEGTGLKILPNGRPIRNTNYGGPDNIHIFFDQNGNSLIRSIPVGIGRANYVVHVVYLVPKSNPMNVDYQVVQDAADLSDVINIQGDGGLQNAIALHALKGGGNILEFEWHHYELKLTPSTNDIKFDIVRSGFQLNNNNLEMTQPTTVASRSIKMKNIYHGAIEVGVLQTNVVNPTYSLVTSPNDPSQKVAKRTDDGKRILATAMYTFYLSPVVLLEKIFQPSKVQNYRLEGRSFVDDHKIYERIYPSVGIGLNDRLLDNVFLGFKFEFIRGGSFFAGYNRSKVNTFDVDETFKFGETPITQEAFDVKKNNTWKGGFCFGLSLDIRIVTNLFQRTTTP